MSTEGEKRCPLCAEEMDWTDQQLKPCKCGYQVCVWCWHQIMDMAEKDETDGRCPACRTTYDKDKIIGMEANFERVVAHSANRKPKPPKTKAKSTEGRKDLTNMRVIQRKMAYVIGLPLSLADEDLLQRKEYFGQYGKVTKVSLSRTAGGAIQQFVNDTCSVYITFSKEEEAIRCIQSIHGFVLDGRFLRASFGTAKYCHAWLRNMPCNNSACLYLHSMGAEEDSFSKDEEAAVHTRSRVQQIVGATRNLHRCSGDTLPPPIDEPFNYSSATSDNPVLKSVLKEVALDAAASNWHSNSLPSCKDKEGDTMAPNKITTFVDIVGRSCSYGPEKDGNVADDTRVENSCSELSSVEMPKDNLLANELPVSKEFKEPFREPLILVASSNGHTKEQSSLILDCGKQILHDSRVPRNDGLSLDDGRLKYSGNSSQIAPSLPPSYPLKTSVDSSTYGWWHAELHNQSEYSMGLNTVNNEDEVSMMCVSSVNDGFNEKKFQSSAKSDRIYRSSNSFSNEEIVEHLRRLDDHDRTGEAQNPSLEAVESSIISNIMSLDLDAGDYSSTLRSGVGGVFGQTDGRHDSSWNLYNNDHAKQQSFVNQLSDLESSFSKIGQDLKKCSVPQDSKENQEQYSYRSQYLVSRAQGPSSPEFSLPSRDPPPGFPPCERTDQGFHANSGSHMVKASSFLNNHYRTPSTGNSSNASDVDIIDPAIMLVGRGKPPNGLPNSYFDTRSNYPSQVGVDDEARLWLLMQQSALAHQDLKYPQTYSRTADANQELRHSGQIGDGYSLWNDMYGISTRYTDHHQKYNPSSYTTPFLQQKLASGNFSNGYQPGLNEIQLRNEMGIAELQRSEKLVDNLYSGYGDFMLQQRAGDLYTRVFGM